MKLRLYMVAISVLTLQSQFVLAQHEHSLSDTHSPVAYHATIHDDVANSVMILKVGPLSLPPDTRHFTLGDLIVSVPVAGWILRYLPEVIDENGNALPGELVHHVTLYNMTERDIVCPGNEQILFATGGELRSWPEIPGSGFPIKEGSRIRIRAMIHNPTSHPYEHVYFQVHIPYQRRTADIELREIHVAWFSVTRCAENGDYDLKPGENVDTVRFTIQRGGRLLGIGGHMHDYGIQLRLENETQKEVIATLNSRLDEQGHLLSLPVALLAGQGGYRLTEGETVRLTSTYINRNGQPLPGGGMGIIVGYFTPDRERPAK